VRLSSIELALIAELNLEAARSYDAVAEDDSQPADARRVAQERRTRLRERAAMFNGEARRAMAEPPLMAWANAGDYTGPERRRGERRAGERRVRKRHAVPVAYERRINTDRRAVERRRSLG
jgi:hypothetical protein